MITDPRPNFTLTFHTTAGTVRMHLELGCWGLVDVHRNGPPVTPSLDPGTLNDVVNRVANESTLVHPVHTLKPSGALGAERSPRLS